MEGIHAKSVIQLRNIKIIKTYHVDTKFIEPVKLLLKESNSIALFFSYKKNKHINSMIFYLVRRSSAYTIVNYLESWGLQTTTSYIRPLFYEQLWQMKKLPTGTYIFSDIERLSPDEAEISSKIWNQLANSGEEIRLLNHPTRSKRRYELLRNLYDKGFNQFNVYRLTELTDCRQPERFPVFIRGENDHGGNRTSLLNTPAELAQAINLLSEKGKSLENKIVTEFCSTADQIGVVRKYSAFIVGDKIIPRHLFFSYNWMIKHPDLVEEKTLLEEQQYIKTNPHESFLKEIFRLARIEYGRIDYSLLNGIPQVWEINTNPMSLSIRDMTSKLQQKRTKTHEEFAENFAFAFRAIDGKNGSSIRISLSNKSHKRRESYPLKIAKILPLSLLKLFPYPYQLKIRLKIRTWLTKFTQQP